MQHRLFFCLCFLLCRLFLTLSSGSLFCGFFGCGFCLGYRFRHRFTAVCSCSRFCSCRGFGLWCRFDHCLRHVFRLCRLAGRRFTVICSCICSRLRHDRPASRSLLAASSRFWCRYFIGSRFNGLFRFFFLHHDLFYSNTVSAMRMLICLKLTAGQLMLLIIAAVRMCMRFPVIFRQRTYQSAILIITVIIVGMYHIFRHAAG